MDALLEIPWPKPSPKRKRPLYLGFVSMTETILLAIHVVSWVVIGVILVVLANTMAMSARDAWGNTRCSRPWALRRPTW